MDLLKFHSTKHRRDPNQVDILGVLHFLFALEIGVHESHTPEEGFLGHLVGGQDLDHPVDHLGSQRGRDRMPGEEAV